MTYFWTAQDIISATNAQYSGAACDISSFTIDNRHLEKDAVYIALKGNTTNGHLYVADALKQGAARAIVSEMPPGDVPKNKLFFVDDTLEALQQLGHYHRKRLVHTKIIGVTGSAGKTTTKEMLKVIFQRYGKTHANFRSYNTMYGLPITIANCPPDTDYGIFELGMNHPGEIRPMAKMLQPDIALITTVAPAHAGFFEGIQDIARAKAEIFEGLSSEGAAIIQGDLEVTPFLIQSAEKRGIKNIVTFGMAQGCNTRLKSYKSQDESCHIEADILGTPLSFELGTFGRHLAMNAIGALTVPAFLKLPLEPGAAALKEFHGAAERGNIRRITFQDGPVTLIDESYNANPAAVTCALDRMSEMRTQGRRIFIFGEMGELGQESAAYHQSLKAPLEQAKIDAFFCCGPEAFPLVDILPDDLCQNHTDSVEDLIPSIIAYVQPHDLIMVKGSLSTRMRKVVEALQTVADDQEKEGF